MPRVSRSAKPQSAVTWVAACHTDTQMRAVGLRGSSCSVAALTRGRREIGRTSWAFFAGDEETACQKAFSCCESRNPLIRLAPA